MQATPHFQDNQKLRRFELHVGGHTAFADYRLEGKTLYLPHVEAPLELRGTGAAGQLMQHVYELAQQNKWEMVPICSYAAAWLRRNKKA